MEKIMLYHANNTTFKVTALSFALVMTLAVEGTLLWHFDTTAKENVAAAAPAQMTLPTVTINARQS